MLIVIEKVSHLVCEEAHRSAVAHYEPAVAFGATACLVVVPAAHAALLYLQTAWQWHLV